MKTKRFILNDAWLMIFFLILPGASNATILFNMPAPGHLTGRVFDEANNQPAKNAHVVLFSAIDSSMVAGTISGNEGDFSLTVLDSGKYYVEIKMPGFNRKMIGPVVFSSRVDVVKLGEVAISAVVISKKETAGSDSVFSFRNKAKRSSINAGYEKGSESRPATLYHHTTF